MQNSCDLYDGIPDYTHKFKAISEEIEKLKNFNAYKEIEKLNEIIFDMKANMKVMDKEMQLLKLEIYKLTHGEQ